MLKAIFLLEIYLISMFWSGAVSFQKAKDNGDIFVMSSENPYELNNAENLINFNETMKVCNASFSIPMDAIEQFQTLGSLPDTSDKTGMCFIRCVYEKSGLIDNWKLNPIKIRANIWPATGDSIPICEQEQKDEGNACVRTYAIAKCLMLRAIVDAKNKDV